MPHDVAVTTTPGLTAAGPEVMSQTVVSNPTVTSLSTIATPGNIFADPGASEHGSSRAACDTRVASPATDSMRAIVSSDSK